MLVKRRRFTFNLHIATLFGFFKPNNDHPVSGHWLQMEKTIGFYKLKNGVSIERKRVTTVLFNRKYSCVGNFGVQETYPRSLRTFIGRQRRDTLPGQQLSSL